MIELIEYLLKSSDHIDQKVMCVRGLFMLLKIDHLTDYYWFSISIDILSAINKIFEV